MPPKNASRNEKDRKRRADGLLRHQQDLAEKQAEIDHLHGSLTGVLGQLANFEGVAEVIRDYQRCMQPWDDNESADLEYCRGCGGRGTRDGMEIARLTAICRKSDCGPLENEIVRLRQQVRTLEERKTGESESEAEEEVEEEVENEMENVALHYAEGELARVKTELEEEKIKNADLDTARTPISLPRSSLRRLSPSSSSLLLLLAKTAWCMKSITNGCQTDTTRSWTITCSRTSR
jgi:hypothetical protein